MSELIYITFTHEGQSIGIQCDGRNQLKNVCYDLSKKINIELESLIFVFGGIKLNLNKKVKEITKEDKINISVYDICTKCGKILDNKIMEEIFIINKNINDKLNLLKKNVELIMSVITNTKDISFINHQLKTFNTFINDIINEDIAKMKNQINKIENNFTINNLKYQEEDKKEEHAVEDNEGEEMSPEEKLENFLEEHQELRNLFKMLKLGVPSAGIVQKAKSICLNMDLVYQLIELAKKVYPNIY